MVGDPLVGPIHPALATDAEAVIQASSDGLTVVVVEESSDGTTWAAQIAYMVGAGTINGVRIYGPTNSWRVKLYSPNGLGIKKATVSTQLRTPMLAASQF